MVTGMGYQPIVWYHVQVWRNQQQMNDFDKDNLQFFLHGDQKEFDEWLDQASPEDIDYAMKLIRQAKLDLIEQEYALYDDIPFTTDAANFLKRFTKK
jgi:glycerol-3-phosphate cytidylyltransferase-like family protein